MSSIYTEGATAADGMVVVFHYTLTDDEGEVIDSSQDGDPMPYLHGAENIVPGLETQMKGKTAGDSFEAKVPAAEAYGEKEGPGPEAVPREAFPEGVEITPGMSFMAEGPEGGHMPIFVTDVDETTVFVDANHPLAGVDLTFAVEIVGIRAASEDEKAHGHPHGIDGTAGHDH